MRVENHLQKRDEEWILKYRAALNGAQPPQSGFTRVRTALLNTCQAVAAQLGKSFARRTPAQPPKPVAVPRSGSKQEPRLQQGARLELRKPSRAQPISKAPSRKTAQTKARSKRLG